MMMSFHKYKVLFEKRLHIKQMSFSLHHFITVYYCKWKEEIRRERKKEIESPNRRKNRKKAKNKEKKKARKEERKNRKKKRTKE